jgi:2-polyprenyl-3-methyl-5-hydroxy-6-metoxy-1,4-benzoquinol methylase
MLILIYSETNEKTVRANLGKPEYSYYFVLKEFRPVLEQLGQVVTVYDPDTEVDALYLAAQARGEDCIFLSFSPPHRTNVNYRCPTVPVFAWEFDTIPHESWLGEPRHDWRYVLERVVGAITHSNFTVNSVKAAMGSDYPVISVPAPVWDRFAHRSSSLPRQALAKSVSLEVDGLLIDSRKLNVQAYGPEAYRQGERIDLYASRGRHTLTLDGVVYSSVFNPFDGRKNWIDMLGVFCWSFRDTPDATLLLKLTHHLVDDALNDMLHHLYKLQPYQCRIVLIHGYLEDADYERLVEATSYVVNTSYGEGQCLPLMEFMSCGKPAIAPSNTAMLDYITEQNAFVVDCTSELTAWPHDPRAAYRTLRYIPIWDSIYNAYRDSYQVAHEQPERYQSMCEAAVASLKQFASQELTRERLHDFIQQRLAAHTTAQQAALAREEQAHVLWTGLRDSAADGWFNRERGEFVKDFAIGPDDKVLDVGCGVGVASLFAASQGASVLFTDTEAQVVETLRNHPDALAARSWQGMVSDSNPLPVADGWASKVVCQEVLEHVDDPRQVMAELVRAGRSGAQYMISVPGQVGEELQKGIAWPGYYQTPNHIRIFTAQDFEQLVSDAGLIIEHRQVTGFYWVMNMIFYWAYANAQQRELHGAIRDDVVLNINPLMHGWSVAWRALLDSPEGLAVKQQLDQFMPKSHVIIARKP